MPEDFSKLIIYNQEDILSLVNKRKAEIKIGEQVTTLPSNSLVHLERALQNNPSKYVLLGLPEDIGIRANKGRSGAHSAWKPALKSFLNTQSNCFLDGKEILVLGHIDFKELMDQADKINFKKADGLNWGRKLVEEIDNLVYPLIKAIIESGKEAIIVGGGHNNAYPNIKGASLAMRKINSNAKSAINCINLDAHADFRPLEGRHSGNGFSYAFHAAYLNKYCIVGLHEGYNSKKVFEDLNNFEGKILYSIYEDIFVRENTSYQEVIKKAIHFLKDHPLGLEIDLDSVQNIPSSAKTSSGISANQARYYVNQVASLCNTVYFHIPEGAPILSHIKADNKTGKLISYLISDYIKARIKRDNSITIQDRSNFKN